ncbi:hypothetical protein SAMN05421858_3717 [Haladaptatus litoreus]|uniref:Uncharacterized protein n=1 Tax=Haladaptatus litoreus TaxID=553468 RepID=A0A1N7DLC9_9EURY|nr:hypothetical protein SAMN05421858_3717 [Haladaptatus litoreus]
MLDGVVLMQLTDYIDDEDLVLYSENSPEDWISTTHPLHVQDFR